MAIDISKATETVQKMLDNGIAALPNLAIAIVVFVAFLLIAKLARSLVRKLFHKIGRSTNVGSVIGRLGQASVILFGLLVALPIVVPSFQTGDVVKMLGLGSVAIGFAFKDIFQNFLSGILILLTDPFRVGDQIKVENYEGTVERIETRATMIRTYDNRRVVIPNSELFTKSVTVNTAYDKRRSSCEVAIDFGEDIDKAKRVILEAIKDIDGVMGDPSPTVVTAKLGSSTVYLNVRWWTNSQRSREMAAQDRVLAAVKQAFEKEGVIMPATTREVYLYDKTGKDEQGNDSESGDRRDSSEE